MTSSTTPDPAAGSESPQAEPALASAETETSSLAARPDHRAWIRLAVAVAFVVGVSATWAFIMRNTSAQKPPEAYGLVLGDDFDRPASTDGLGSNSRGVRWTSVSGLWNVDAGKAVVAYPDPATSLATIGAVESAAISVRISGKAQCGVVARYVDERNYLELVRAPKFAVWNVVSVVDGKETVVTKVPDVKDSAVTVRLETGTRVVTAFVANRTSTAVLPTDVSSAPVGLIAHGNDATACTWDDLLVSRGK